jgi:hypothetical protein
MWQLPSLESNVLTFDGILAGLFGFTAWDSFSVEKEVSDGLNPVQQISPCCTVGTEMRLTWLSN